MIDFQRVIKECFWDMDMDADTIQAIIKGGDMQKKAFVFEKILLHSTKLFSDLALFDPEILKILLQNYQIPRFNGEYAFKRKNMTEVYFFDQPLLIEELKWTA
jgi:hypothetical protein